MCVYLKMHCMVLNKHDEHDLIGLAYISIMIWSVNFKKFLSQPFWPIIDLELLLIEFEGMVLNLSKKFRI